MSILDCVDVDVLFNWDSGQGITTGCTRSSVVDEEDNKTSDDNHDLDVSQWDCEGTWCWNGGPKTVYELGSTFTGWVDGDGFVWAYQYDHVADEAHKTVLNPWLVEDDHVAPSVYVHPQDHHVSYFYARGNNGLRYRILSRPLDVREFGPERQWSDNYVDYLFPIPLESEDTFIRFTIRVTRHIVLGRSAP